MATWASLSQAQQDAVQSLVNAERGLAQQMARVTQLASAISAAWNGGISDVVGTLGANEVIPSTSGLAGAQGVVPADVTNFAGYAIVFSDPARSPTGSSDTGGGGYSSNFIHALEVKLCGINASLTQ